MLWLLLPMLPWVLMAGWYIYPRLSAYSDLTISHIPNALYLLRSLQNYGEIPYWSNAIYSGYPFAASPLAGIWYPPGWLAYLLPLQLGFNLVTLAHILWGAVGVYLFLHRQKLKPAAVICGALSFAAMPKIFAHFAAGHVTLVYAVSWSPWLLVAAQKFTSQSRKRPIGWIMPGCILGIIGLADIRWLPASFALWFGYTGWCIFYEKTALSGRSGVGLWFTAGIAALLICVGASFVLLGSLSEFTRLSTRALMDAADVLAFSLPPEKLLGLFVPDFGGFAEWVSYLGAAGFLMMIYCLAVPKVRRRSLFWLIIFVGAVVISLGEHIPWMQPLASLPGFDLLRVPSRVLFLAGLSSSILLAYGIDDLLDRTKPNYPDPVFFMTPVAGFVVMLFAGVWAVTGNAPINFLWAGIFMVSVIGWTAFEERGRLPAAVRVLIIPVVITIDLVGSNIQAVELRPIAEINAEGLPVAEFLSERPGIYRIYTPSNSLPQLTAARWGIEMVNGIDPMQIRTYAEFMGRASGVGYQKYSVTIPPFENGDPVTANRDAIPDGKLLGLLNVKYLAAEFPVISPDWKEVGHLGETWIYENLFFRPRAWIQPGTSSIESEWQAVAITSNMPGKVQLKAEGPGLVVLSDNYYPGWRVSVDGSQGELLRVANILMGVSIDSGVHWIEFSYFPKMIYTGAAVSAVNWLLIILMMVISFRQDI